ncbi:hypothetical protein DWV55_02765 [Butyricicoccus sp. AF10-3]|nr:hypothetical protein [Butyricicoccus sp. AF10-3]RHS38121.1 hypothetical protein DWV55_02765 [Butyricicoccus sp. AF10-3]
MTYELGTDAISFTTAGYYDATKGNAEVKGDKLILPIQAVKTDTTGNIGSVKVKVSTTNYHDFTLTINVNATNKIVPTGEPTLSATTLTYGQALSAIKLSGKLHDNVNNKNVEGMFMWADGTVKPNAGSYEAAWKFTPADGDTYTEADGTVTITVNKAKPPAIPPAPRSPPAARRWQTRRWPSAPSLPQAARLRGIWLLTQSLRRTPLTAGPTPRLIRPTTKL